MLAGPLLRIEHLVVNVVAKLVFEGVFNDPKRLAFVMTCQVFYVLEQKGIGLLVSDDASDLEEQSALGFVLKASRAP